MLTPLDIHNKEFKRSLRGYDIDDVDAFLDEVIKDFESLYAENLKLKEDIGKYQDQIERYREMEETLQNTMILAQKMAEEAKRNTDKETELIIWEARKKAEQIVGSAHDEVTETIKKVQQLKALEQQMKVRLKAFLNSQLELIDSELHEKKTAAIEVREPEVNELVADN